MFPLAGQTAGPNGLIFLGTLMGSREVTKAKKIKFFFLTIFHNFFSIATPGPSACISYIIIW